MTLLFNALWLWLGILECRNIEPPFNISIDEIRWDYTFLPQASLGLAFTVITAFLFCRLARTKAYSAWQDAKKTFCI